MKKSLNIYTLAIPALCLLLLGVVGHGCKQNSGRNKTEQAVTPPAYAEILLFTSSGQIFLTDPAGTTLEKIPEAGRSVWFPAVSPDFRSVSYWSNASGSFELWSYDFEPGLARQLTFFNETNEPSDLKNFSVHNAPTWSPDGKHIVFSKLGKLWRIDRGGFNLETLTVAEKNYSPAWSPDGKFLVFVSLRNQARNLYLLDITSGDEWPLSTFPATHSVGGPAWSPDGKRIAFSLTAFDSVNIWTVNPIGGELKQLTRDGRSNAPAWSPDSQKIAFSSGRQDIDRWEIWIMNADGSGQFSVTRNGGFSPSWMRRIGLAESSRIDRGSPLTTVPVRRLADSPEPAPSPSKMTLTDTPLDAPARPIAQAPTPVPTRPIAQAPTQAPTRPIAQAPTQAPTRPIAQAPTQAPTRPIAQAPTQAPTRPIAQAPTQAPTRPIAQAPTQAPTQAAAKKISTGKTTTAGSSAKTKSSETNYEEFEEYADEDETVLPEPGAKSSPSQNNQIVFSPKIEFYFAKDLIKSSSLPALKQLAEELNRHVQSPLVVEGRIQGPRWFTVLKSLSRARANSVLRHLIVNEKIRHINVTAIGEGDAFPELDTADDLPVLLVIIK